MPQGSVMNMPETHSIEVDTILVNIQPLEALSSLRVPQGKPENWQPGKGKQSGATKIFPDCLGRWEKPFLENSSSEIAGKVCRDKSLCLKQSKAVQNTPKPVDYRVLSFASTIAKASTGRLRNILKQQPASTQTLMQRPPASTASL